MTLVEDGKAKRRRNRFRIGPGLPIAALALWVSLAAAADAATDDPWVAVGWGDERFYTQTGLTFGRAMDGLRALWCGAARRSPVPEATIPA